MRKAGREKGCGQNPQPWERRRLGSRRPRRRRQRTGKTLALLRLEARVGLVDHIDLALAAHDLAVAVTGLERLERAADLHGRRASEKRKQKSREADLAAGAVPIE